MPDLSALDPLLQSAQDAPVAMRALVGAASGLMLLAGARVYEWALFGSAVLLGTVGGASLVVLVDQAVPGAATPVALAIGGLVGGALLLGLAKATHKAALVGVGGLLGAAGGSAVAALAGGVWWAPLAGALVGAIALPFLFQTVLKIVTPGVGAVGIAWAVGMPEKLWLLGLLWVFGTGVQLGFIRTREREEPED
ncbi:MAG: hypothetical protein EP330_18135 [Deltaproteobacteria bacterium]|nr:MAG: hypothetical protein EP330_18135 [Deltaproteobacteria bacterium]